MLVLAQANLEEAAKVLEPPGPTIPMSMLDFDCSRPHDPRGQNEPGRPEHQLSSGGSAPLADQLEMVIPELPKRRRKT
jgi:hypothetical protein